MIPSFTSFGALNGPWRFSDKQEPTRPIHLQRGLMRLRTPSWRLLTGVLTLAFFVMLMRFPQAATDAEIRPVTPPPKKDEIRVPIPGFSPEVRSNGCHVRQSPDEITEAGKAGLPEIALFA